MSETIVIKVEMIQLHQVTFHEFVNGVCELENQTTVDVRDGLTKMQLTALKKHIAAAPSWFNANYYAFDVDQIDTH